jgi:hypothetical protein
MGLAAGWGRGTGSVHEQLGAYAAPDLLWVLSTCSHLDGYSTTNSVAQPSWSALQLSRSIRSQGLDSTQKDDPTGHSGVRCEMRQFRIRRMPSSGMWRHVALARTDVSEERIAEVAYNTESIEGEKRNCKVRYPPL